jgi:hypothetical protein
MGDRPARTLHSELGGFLPSSSPPGSRDAQHPSRRRRRIGAASILALAAGALVASASSADLMVNGTLFTPTKVTASTRYILYYLQMHSSSSSEELFSVRMTPPHFATVGSANEGDSIDGPTDIVLQGPGTLGQLVQSPSIITPCSPRESAFHGYATGSASIDVLLPPDSATTLAVRYGSGRRAPWVDSDFRLRFTVQTQLVGSYPAGSPFGATPTVTTPITMTTAGPTVGGRTGVHILLSTDPRGTPGAPYAPRKISRDRAVAISGRILPASAGRLIVLQWSHGNGVLHTLARVRTTTGGRFSLSSWHPGSSGTYDLWARYPAQPGGLVADSTSCPVRFTVP